jgi:hypothetical protein
MELGADQGGLLKGLSSLFILWIDSVITFRSLAQEKLNVWYSTGSYKVIHSFPKY